MPGDSVKVPPPYRPLLRRLQQGTWTRDELRWLLAHNPHMPVIVAGLVRQKLAEIGGRDKRGRGCPGH